MKPKPLKWLREEYNGVISLKKAALAKIIAMILLGYLMLRPGRRFAAFAILILVGVR